MICWIDIETTGLNPRSDLILEVAIAIQHTVWARPYPESRVRSYRRDWSDYIDESVVAMHTKNGLFNDCESDNALTFGELERWILDQLPGEDHSYTLAGASVHFDLSFLQHDMPLVASKFFHRLLDTSAVGLFAQSLGMPYEKKESAHRASADIIQCWNGMRKMRAWFAGTPLNGGEF